MSSTIPQIGEGAELSLFRLCWPCPKIEKSDHACRVLEQRLAEQLKEAEVSKQVMTEDNQGLTKQLVNIIRHHYCSNDQ